VYGIFGVVTTFLYDFIDAPGIDVIAQVNISVSKAFVALSEFFWIHQEFEYPAEKF